MWLSNSKITIMKNEDAKFGEDGWFSWLTIRKDLQEEELSIPIEFLDGDKEEIHLDHSDDLNIDYLRDNDGAPIIKDDFMGRDLLIEVSCPSKGWHKREAIAYNIDFDWN